MLTLRPPQHTDAQLRLLAAAGRSAIARKAREELSRRLHEQLRREVQGA